MEGHTYLLRFAPLKHLDSHKTLMTESQQRQARLCREVPSTPGRCGPETAQAGGRTGGGLQAGPKEVLCGHVRGGRNGDKLPEDILGHVNVVVGDEQGFLDVLI